MTDNSIFKRIGKRILDPYNGKVVLEIRRRDNDEVKLQEQVRVITMAQIQRKDVAREESSPLDDLIEGFHRDANIQDPVEIVRVKTVPKVPKEIKKPAAKPVAKQLTRREQRDIRNEERRRAWNQEPNTQVDATEEPEEEVEEGTTGAAWTQEQFWVWIAGLGWGDRSDNPSVRTAEGAIRRLSPTKRQGMMLIYEQLYSALSENLNNFLRGYDMGDDNRRAILSHIIARGENFYNAICADPDFASYLISDASRPAEHNEFIDFSKLL